MRVLGYLLAPLLVLGGLAFVIDSSILYAILVVSLFVLLAWAASASWVIGRRPLAATAPGAAGTGAVPAGP